MKYGYHLLLAGLLVLFAACGSSEAPAVEEEDTGEETEEQVEQEETEENAEQEEESEETPGNGSAGEDAQEEQEMNGEGELSAEEEEELWFFLGEWNRTEPANASLSIAGYTMEVTVDGSTVIGSLELESSTDATFTADDGNCELFFDVMERGTMEVTEVTECSALESSPEGIYHDY